MSHKYKWNEAFERAFNGDRRLLDEHISQFYNSKLYPIILGRTQSRDTAHEVCSVTMTKFWNKFYIKRDALPDNVNGYIYAMANNAFYQVVGMKSKERDFVNHLKETKILEAINGNSNNMEESEAGQMENLYKALELGFAQLGERCRELLNLNILQKQTIRSIAPKMKFPTENAATQKKTKCIKALRKLIYSEIHNQD